MGKSIYRRITSLPLPSLIKVKILLFWQLNVVMIIVDVVLLLLGRLMSNGDFTLEEVFSDLVSALESLVNLVLEVFSGLLSLDGLFLSDFLNLGDMLSQLLSLVFPVGGTSVIS